MLMIGGVVYWTCERGHTANIVGLLLKACGLHVTSIKIGLCFWIDFFFFNLVFAAIFFLNLHNLQQVRGCLVHARKNMCKNMCNVV